MRRTTKVSLGLFATWALSDLEEVWTMSRTSKALSGQGFSQRHVNASIGLMGVVMGTAAVLGVRSRGRSPVFRGALLGFGLHGFGHLAMAAAAGRYVSGAATAPTMVIPYWLWARRELAREGIRDVDRATVAVAAAGIPLLAGIHGLVSRLLHEKASE